MKRPFPPFDDSWHARMQRREQRNSRLFNGFLTALIPIILYMLWAVAHHP